MSNNDPTLPRDKVDLMKRIESEWSVLMRVIDGRTPEQLSTPLSGGWSAKDNLAHLAAWEQFLLHHYMQGEPPHQAFQMDAVTFEGLDETAINAIIQQRNRQRFAAELVAELERSHAQVVEALEARSFEELMQPLRADDPAKRPLINWVIGNTYEHYKEHRQNIERGV